MLARVCCVEYRLHPTFSDPVRKVCEKGSPERPFALTTRGWGTFHLKLRVAFDGGIERELVHPLRFLSAAPVQ